MADGGEGEDEIQFLRTVSAAQLVFSWGKGARAGWGGGVRWALARSRVSPVCAVCVRAGRGPGRCVSTRSCKARDGARRPGWRRTNWVPGHRRRVPGGCRVGERRRQVRADPSAGLDLRGSRRTGAHRGKGDRRARGQ